MNESDDNVVLTDNAVAAGPRIMLSTWCVECRKQTPATYIYEGNSLCALHFKAKTDR